MRIAITGARGRVGRSVVDLALSDRHSVVAIDRVVDGDPPDTETAQLDLRDYAAIVDTIRGCDALIHLAAINGPGRDPDHVVHGNNVVSSYNALRAASEVGIRRVCMASSINAIGGRFSRRPRYDYLPVDELHPAYPEDPYSLSKLIGERQAEAMARRDEGMTVASLRLHGVVADRVDTLRWLDLPGEVVAKQLWGYTLEEAAARAFLLGATAPFHGHEVFYIVAPRTMMDTPSSELKERYYPDVELRGDLDGNQGFFDCGKAAGILGWRHDEI